MSETEVKEYIRDEILDTEEMKKLFILGISPDATDDEVKAYFEEQAGCTVTDIAVIRRDGNEKKNLFGFVTLESSEHVDELLLKKDDLNFKDNKIDINRAVPKTNRNEGANQKTKKLYMANVPKIGVTEDDLKKYFEERHDPKYGTIESVELVQEKDPQTGEKNGKLKGFGFVMVSSEDLANKMSIQHASFEFGGRKIELKKARHESSGRGRGRGGPPGGGYGGYGQMGYGGGYGGYGGYGPMYGGGYGGGYGGVYGGGYGGGYGGQRYQPY